MLIFRIKFRVIENIFATTPTIQKKTNLNLVKTKGMLGLHKPNLKLITNIV